MTYNYNENDLVKGINENISFVKNIPVEDADKCSGSIRSALEYAVKLFWLKKYDKKPVWVKGYIECFDLYKAINDERFSKYFSKMTLSNMHTIRQTCNGVLHDNDPLTLDEASDLLDMLEKCIKAIENAIPMQIISSIIIEDEGDLGHTPPGNITDISISETSHNRDSERKVFWKMFQEALDNNGNPFTISTRNQYGTINRNKSYSNLCLGFDFLLQKKFFRIGIYVEDDTKTPCFDRLLQQKEEIESLLGFAPIWTTRGEKNPNTKRIEYRLKFIPYNRKDYERLIKDALPIFMRFIKVFSKYLPEAFAKV